MNGCDTISYFYGKLKYSKNYLVSHILESVILRIRNQSNYRITKNVIENNKEFIRAALYDGNKKSHQYESQNIQRFNTNAFINSTT